MRRSFIHNFIQNTSRSAYREQYQCNCTGVHLSFPLMFFHWIQQIQGQKYCILKRLFEPATSCVRDQEASTERIFKLSPIHASVIYPIPWICWIHWISHLFRENSINVIREGHIIIVWFSDQSWHSWPMRFRDFFITLCVIKFELRPKLFVSNTTAYLLLKS